MCRGKEGGTHKIKNPRFKRLEKPYDFECPSCGCTLTRYTDLLSKRCDCGTSIFFKSKTDKENTNGR